MPAGEYPLHQDGLANGIEKIWLDGLNEVVLDVSSPLVGAPAAHAMGYDGTGIVVAVLDSGIDDTHPDLSGKVIEAVNFSLFDPQIEDKEGHGTHVASTIAGSGANSEGAYRGIAPGVELLNVKVCRFNLCTDSSVLAGLEWTAERGAHVVNLSFGSEDSHDIDPIEAAVNQLTEQYDILFVAAAGNDGWDMTVSSPGSADAVLTVAAVDDEHQLAAFSSRGPRIGDYGAKPDIAAPGVNIMAAASSVKYTNTDYVSLSGTSMATPLVTGAAAILRQRYPDMTAGQIKSILMSSANPSPSLNGFQQGAGSLDILAALDQQITANPRSLSCGGYLYPHGDDSSVSQSVEFSNPTSEDVVLDLQLQFSTENLPAGMFTVSPQTLQIPSGGSASADFFCDPNLGGESYGLLGGTLVGTSASETVSVPFGVFREGEMYNVTFVQKTRTGVEPQKIESSLVATVQNPRFVLGERYGSSSYEQEFTIRLPRQSYFKNAFVVEETPEGKLHTFMQSEPFELLGDRVLVFDPEQATEVKKPTVFNEDAEHVHLRFKHIYEAPIAETFFHSVIAPEDRLFLLQEGNSPSPNTKWLLLSMWVQKDAEGPAKQTYSASWKGQYTILEGFEANLQRSDFAKIHTSYRPHGADSHATTSIKAVWHNPGTIFPEDNDTLW